MRKCIDSDVPAGCWGCRGSKLPCDKPTQKLMFSDRYVVILLKVKHFQLSIMVLYIVRPKSVSKVMFCHRVVIPNT